MEISKYFNQGVFNQCLLELIPEQVLLRVRTDVASDVAKTFDNSEAVLFFVIVHVGTESKSRVVSGMQSIRRKLMHGGKLLTREHRYQRHSRRCRMTW